MQKDLLIGDPSTFTFRGLSSVPQGTEWCLVPVITSLPESLSHSMTMLDDEPTLLQVDLSQFTTEGHESKSLFLSGSSTSTSPTCLTMVPPPKAESSQHDHGGQ